ncbi:hypothetical protein [Actinoallomurus sp. NPDC050550]|uniref:hypothetical protein n=1 Tax=Actinoallomurus sp. NPDC050550 TaxID=3154937 RepID=UPI0033D2D36E
MTTDNQVRVGLVAGGLGAYWPQFADLLLRLQRTAERTLLDTEVAAAAERLRPPRCDMIVGFLTTYLASSPA